MNTKTSERLREPYKEEESGLWLLPLTRGYISSIDEEDVEFISNWTWFALEAPHTTYVVRNARKADNKKGLIYLHRELLQPPADMEVDHLDRNGLNNSRVNLRLASRLENSRNRGPDRSGTSKFKGVSWSADRNKWLAQLHTQDKKYNLGRFSSETEAAEAYNKKALEIFGSFAATNPQA